MKRTLVKFTLLAAFDGDENTLALEDMGDRLAELLRADDRTLTVASEYDSVVSDVPEDEEGDELVDALVKQFPQPQFTEDRCQVCGALIGVGLNVMHIGVCDTCRTAPKH